MYVHVTYQNVRGEQRILNMLLHLPQKDHCQTTLYLQNCYEQLIGIVNPVGIFFLFDT